MSRAGQVQFILTTQEADAVRGFMRAAEALNRVEGGTKKVAQETGFFGGILGRAGNELKGMIAGYFGVNAAISGFSTLLRLNTEEINKNVEAATRLALARLDLQFLSQDYKPEEIAAVRRAGEITGDLPDAFRAFGELRSKASHLSEADQLALFQEIVETKLTTTAPMSELIRLFVETREHIEDPQQLQNLLRKAQEFSPASTPERMAKALPQLLEVGREAGLDPDQIAGITAAALLADEESGDTVARNLMAIFAGGMRGPARKLFEKHGATPDKGFMEQMRILAEADLPVEDAARMVGRENFAVLLNLLRNRERTEGFIGGIRDARLGPEDLTAQALTNVLGKDEGQRLRLQTAQAAARAEGIRGDDTGAQRVELGRQLLQESLLRQGRPAIVRGPTGGLYTALTAMGFEPGTIANLFGGPTERDIDRGLAAGPDLDVGQIGRIGTGKAADKISAAARLNAKAAQLTAEAGKELQAGAAGGASGSSASPGGEASRNSRSE